MPIKDERLNSEFSGKIIDLIKLKNEGWSDQGSENYHYGFTQKKGLWIKRIDSAYPCSHHTIWLFLMLYTKENIIDIIKTAVHQVSLDGGFHDLNIPFVPPDRDNAMDAINAILAGNQNPSQEGKTLDFRKPKMRLTGIEIFKMLPKTNCKECGSPTCLAFAMALASGKTGLEDCPYMSEEAREKLGGAASH